MRDEPRLLNRIKVLRTERDWTQAELARRVGVTRKTINTIERSVFVPSTILALRLAECFDTTVETVFQLPPDRSPP